MSRVSTLERLQSIDLEIDDKTKQAQLVRQQLDGDPALMSLRAALDNAEKELAQVRTALRSREMDAQSLDARIRGIEERLYGGKISNPKELDGLEKELQMFRRQRSGMDDQLLELMEAVDSAQAHASVAAGALKQAEGQRAVNVERLAQERHSLESRLSGLLAERQATVAGIDADSLRTYDRLRQTKAGRAVAVIRHSACGVCGVAVPTGLVQRVHAGSELVFCSGCGRILAG